MADTSYRHLFGSLSSLNLQSHSTAKYIFRLGMVGKTTKTLQNWQKYIPVPVVGWEREYEGNSEKGEQDKIKNESQQAKRHEFVVCGVNDVFQSLS